MQLDQLYLDEVLFDIYPVSGVIKGDTLPSLHLGTTGLYYFNDTDGTTMYAKQHEVYIHNNARYMILDGKWCQIV